MLERGDTLDRRTELPCLAEQGGAHVRAQRQRIEGFLERFAEHRRHQGQQTHHEERAALFDAPALGQQFAQARALKCVAHQLRGPAAKAGQRNERENADQLIAPEHHDCLRQVRHLSCHVEIGRLYGAQQLVAEPDVGGDQLLDGAYRPVHRVQLREQVHCGQAVDRHPATVEGFRTLQEEPLEELDSRVAANHELRVRLDFFRDAGDAPREEARRARCGLLRRHLAEVDLHNVGVFEQYRIAMAGHEVVERDAVATRPKPTEGRAHRRRAAYRFEHLDDQPIRRSGKRRIAVEQALRKIDVHQPVPDEAFEPELEDRIHEYRRSRGCRIDVGRHRFAVRATIEQLVRDDLQVRVHDRLARDERLGSRAHPAVAVKRHR